MALTKEDLQAIAGLINDSVSASESRMQKHMESSIVASEGRTNANILETRNHMMAYFENKVEKQIKQIAEGHLMLAEKMERMETKFDAMQADIDEIKATVTAHEVLISNNY